MATTDPKEERTSGTITIKVDRDLCIGAATCVALAPKAFALDDEAKAIIIDSVDEEKEDMVIEAAKACPVMAIILERDGKQIYP